MQTYHTLNDTIVNYEREKYCERKQVYKMVCHCNGGLNWSFGDNHRYCVYIHSSENV